MATLRTLPPEIIRRITGDLANVDIKCLRLAGKDAAQLAQLRLGRVFLSTNCRDIEVLREIAQSETYCDGIVELIYDDARFVQDQKTQDDVDYGDSDYSQDPDESDASDSPPSATKVPLWYSRIFEEHCQHLADTKGNLVERPFDIYTREMYKSRLSLQQSYDIYQGIAQDQAQVIATGSDRETFRYALQKFVNLRKITVTPITHGEPFRPYYETPTIRNLPRGFIYPIPAPWPASETAGGACVYHEEWKSDHEKARWRGVCLVLRELAQLSHHVTEFTIEVNQLRTGLNCRMFERMADNQEYTDLVSLLQRPGLTRFDLALSTGEQENDHWQCYQSGLIHEALSNAKELRHVSLATGLIVPTPVVGPWKYPGQDEKHFFPMRSIFPVDQWTHLQHFGLSRFIVKQNDLIAFLNTMPSTLRSVELSFLYFMWAEGDYREFLQDLRDKLDWREWHPLNRPRITICLNVRSQQVWEGHCIDISDEAEDFIYRDGQNPFGNDTSVRGRTVYKRLGLGIERKPWSSL